MTDKTSASIEFTGKQIFSGGFGLSAISQLSSYSAQQFENYSTTSFNALRTINPNTATASESARFAATILLDLIKPRS